ncbi:MAG: amino acid transporter [Francisellaceae bacterium]|jgi:amino acid transporter
MEKKKIGLISATFLGVSSIIGSGWLFAPYKTAQIAGPLAILTWIIGAAIILLLAFCFSEVAVRYPKRGLSAIVATLTHNEYFGFPFAIANWLGIVAVIALEADATVEYLISLSPSMAHIFFANQVLTFYGELLSAGLVFVYAITNYWGVQSLIKTNNILSVIKVFVPILTAIVIMSVAFHTENFTVVKDTVAPYGYQAIFTAIISTGIIIAFNGFQSVISFSSEIKNPRRNIPLSLVLSIVICLVIYLLLQVCFIAGVSTSDLKNGGWTGLTFSAPMVELAAALGLGFFSTIIYLGAATAPLGTAMTFVGTSTRMFTAMSRQKQVPAYFDNVHPKYGISRRSLAANIVFALIFVFAFKSWSLLAQILSIFHVFSYLPVVLALVIFRSVPYKKNEEKFKIPFGKVIAVGLFIIFNYLLTYSNDIITLEVVGCFLLFQIIFIACSCRTAKALVNAITKSAPVFIFLFVLLALVHASPTNADYFGGPIFFAVTGVFSCVSFYLLTKLGLNENLHEHVGNSN